MYKNNNPSYSFIIGLIIIIFTLIISGYRSCSIGTGEVRYVTTVVTDKGIKRIHDKDTYLIYTKDSHGEIEVFQITDSVLAGRFNSADVYAGIEVGEEYKFGIRGDRTPLFSWYPNIYSYEKVD